MICFRALDRMDRKGSERPCNCYHMLQHQEHPGYLYRTLIQVRERVVSAFVKSLLFGRMTSKLGILIQVFNQETFPDPSYPSPIIFTPEKRILHLSTSKRYLFLKKTMNILGAAKIKGAASSKCKSYLIK